MAEKEKSAAERRYGDKKNPEEKPAEKREPVSGNREEAHEGGEEKSPRAEMMKRHMKEARDLHGSHRDQIKAMHGRHEAEMATAGETEAPQEPAEPAAEATS